MRDKLFLLWWGLLCINHGLSLPCTWDFQIPPREREKENCGYICNNPWGRKDPHYCGSPHACCCAPTCNNDVAAATSVLGINWNDLYMKRPLPRTHQLQILKDSGFYHIKTFTPSGLEDIWRVFGSTASVYVGIPNRQLARLAIDLDYARRIVREQLYKYRSIIKLIIVGNEPLICIKTENWAKDGECGALNNPVRILPAMKMIYTALILEGMPRRVTTALNGGIMEMSTNPWTPCVADYKHYLKPILRPIWDFLRETESPFIVNLYSWFASKEGYISPKLACGYPDNSIPTDGKYNYYFNFDMQLDMNRVAMCKNDIQDLDLWVGETGWPTNEHPKATLTNGYWYLEHAIRRSQGLSINDPEKDNFRFRGLSFSLFLFEAFDEEKKSEIEHGNQFENTFGLFYEDGTPKWRDSNGMLRFNMTSKTCVDDHDDAMNALFR